ncbi:MAG TPA: serine/threonine-protein kinase [Streptosporangiaceae bacterium]
MDTDGSSDLPGRAEQLQPDDPTAVGPYQIVGRLGAGGMGAVYLGRADDGQVVAVKVIRPGLAEDRAFRERFESEVQNAKRVASFCTAAVIGSGVHDERPYLVTEYIDGPTLYDQVGTQGALAPGTLHGVAVGVAAALTAIHAAGLVHRDLKPSNVILSMSGPRVIDFGIARALDATSFHTATGDLIGSPGWMAPEHLLRQHVTTASDVFAWGCLVAFSGRARHPYGEGEPIAMIARIIHGEPELDGLPGKLAPLVEAALSKDPNARPSAQQLLLDLVGGAPQRINTNVSQVLEETWQSPEPDAGQTRTDEPKLAAGPAPSAPAAAPVQSPPAGPAPSAPAGPAPSPPAGPAPSPPAAPAPSPSAAADAGRTQLDDVQPDTIPRQTRGTLPAPPPADLATDPGKRASRDRADGGDRRRPYVLGGAIAAAVAVIAVVAALLGNGLFSGGGKANEGSTSGAGTDVLARQGFTPAPLRPATDVGRPVTGSSLEFTAGHPRCGGKSYGGQTAQGRFCLVPVSIRNVAEPTEGLAHPVKVPRARQQLIDSAGAAHTPVRVNGGFLTNDTPITPGGMIAGELVFDVPSGANPAQLKLYASATDKGVSLWV